MSSLCVSSYICTYILWYAFLLYFSIHMMNHIYVYLQYLQVRHVSAEGAAGIAMSPRFAAVANSNWQTLHQNVYNLLRAGGMQGNVCTVLADPRPFRVIRKLRRKKTCWPKNTPPKTQEFACQLQNSWYSLACSSFALFGSFPARCAPNASFVYFELVLIIGGHWTSFSHLWV